MRIVRRLGKERVEGFPRSPRQILSRRGLESTAQSRNFFQRIPRGVNRPNVVTYSAGDPSKFEMQSGTLAVIKNQGHECSAVPAISCCPSLNDNRPPSARYWPYALARLVLIPDSICVLGEDTPDPSRMSITVTSYGPSINMRWVLTGPGDRPSQRSHSTADINYQSARSCFSDR